MILHTWDQKLNTHLHIHCAIPAFALLATAGEPAGALGKEAWVHAREDFLFPVKAMAVMFRGKFLDGLKRLHLQQKLNSPPGYSLQLQSLYEKDWVVYAKPAFKGPQTVLDYIGRYTHRVALSNERILAFRNNQVTFSYRDRQDSNRNKSMTLSSEEFIRRFLLHVLPASFLKIRHIGFLANKAKKKSLARCRELLKFEEIRPEEKTPRELMRELTGVDLDRCPRCRTGIMIASSEIPPASWNTS